MRTRSTSVLARPVKRPRAAAQGDVAWNPDPDHATLTSYEVRLYPQGGGSLVASKNVGKPVIVGGDCLVNLATWFGTQPAGNYELKVASIAPGGTTESTVSNAFSLPLP